MVLWILKPEKPGKKPWGGYDTCNAMIVLARTEKGARLEAGKNAMGEGEAAWEDSNLSSCTKLPTTGIDKLIMREEAWG